MNPVSNLDHPLSISIPGDGLDQLLSDYRWLHQNPELSMQEHATAKFIEERLTAMRVDHFRCGGTGVVAVLRNGDGPIAGFRADIDALPIKEQTGLDYSSSAYGINDEGAKVPVMHACGHDAHTAMALASMRALEENRSIWSGTAVFIFQPGEETASGAMAMVADGLWDKAPVPEVLFAQHITPMEIGTVSLTSGPAFSMADSLKVLVRGRQAHGSQPQNAIDPVVLAAHMVVRMQSIISREVPPQESAVITVGSIHAGYKENIIPELAEFTINIRTFLPQVRSRVLDSIHRVIQGEAVISGAEEPEVEEINSFPTCYNDPELTRTMFNVLGKALGEEKVVASPPGMASEDFGHLGSAHGIPSVYWRIGAYSADRIAGGQAPANHSPQFAPQADTALWPGVQAATAAMVSVLQQR